MRCLPSTHPIISVLIHCYDPTATTPLLPGRVEIASSALLPLILSLCLSEAIRIEHREKLCGKRSKWKIAWLSSAKNGERAKQMKSYTALFSAFAYRVDSF